MTGKDVNLNSKQSDKKDNEFWSSIKNAHYFKSLKVFPDSKIKVIWRRQPKPGVQKLDNESTSEEEMVPGLSESIPEAMIARTRSKSRNTSGNNRQLRRERPGSGFPYSDSEEDCCAKACCPYCLLRLCRGWGILQDPKRRTTNTSFLSYRSSRSSHTAALLGREESSYSWRHFHQRSSQRFIRKDSEDVAVDDSRLCDHPINKPKGEPPPYAPSLIN